MAVRMNVLVLRPPGNGSKAHHQFDDVIGQLLGRPGLDVTLLERLPSPEESTTERLALESLGGHIACLAWAGAGETVHELAAAGKSMSRRPHRGDPDAANGNETSGSSGNGRMFFFDMRRPGANVAIFGDLQDLLKTLQTPTFRIGPASPPKKPSRPQPPTVVATEQTATPADNDWTGRKSAAPIDNPIDSAERASDDDDEGDLDRLVDQLDELDL